MKPVLYVLLMLFFVACSDGKKPVAIGLDGRAFFEPERSATHEQQLQENLREAKQQFEENASEENYIWYGRREGYLLHLEKAIEIFTRGLEKYPDSYRLYRHRAHRYLSVREFEKAIRDGKRAAELAQGKPVEIELDGAPNKLNIPKSTTQSNIWYHLGLAYYLKGDYEQAAKAYETCMQFSDNDDLLVATTDWLYITYQRIGRKDSAEALLTKIERQMNILENEAYHKRLLLYKGQYQPEQLLAVVDEGQDPDIVLATQGYGVGNWYLLQGDTAKATALFKRVVEGPSFTAFGFIAAESDLQRLQK